MNRKLILNIVFILAAFQVSAQFSRQQWATSVIEVSSQLSKTQYSADQALGRPNVLPGYGENPSAWVPSSGGFEFLKVGFSNPTRVCQVAIAESNFPGGLSQLFLYDTEGKEHLINTFYPKQLDLRSRLLRIYFPLTSYKVVAAKIVLDVSSMREQPAIDAIGISASRQPIELEIIVSEESERYLWAEHLGEGVNSPYREHMAVLSPDGKTMYFSRQNHPNNIGGATDEDIWIATLDEKRGEWGTAVNAGAPLNNAFPNFVCAISSTQKGELFILLGNEYNEDGSMTDGASTCTLTANGYTKPIPVKIPDHQNTSPKTDYYMTTDHKVMLMSIERFDAIGDRDIYVSFRKGENSWSEPVNLGPIINTVSEESAPFMIADDQTLYFASKGHSGFGDSDIFVTRRLDDSWQKWSEPENLGPIINTAFDDAYYYVSKLGDFIYYSRGVSDTDVDMFRIPLLRNAVPKPISAVTATKLTMPVNIVINKKGEYLTYKHQTIEEILLKAKADSTTADIARSNGSIATNEPLALAEQTTNAVERKAADKKANVKTLTDDNSTIAKGKSNSLPNPRNNPAAANMLRGKKTNYKVKDENMSSDTSKTNPSDMAINIKDNDATNPDAAKNSGGVAHKRIPRAVLDEFRKTMVAFGVGRSIVPEVIKPQLSKLVIIMKKYPSISVEIDGHTDNSGNAELNRQLSEKRAGIVRAYFAENGVDTNRVRSVGFGEERPRFSNENKETRKKNRRVEFIPVIEGEK